MVIDGRNEFIYQIFCYFCSGAKYRKNNIIKKHSEKNYVCDYSFPVDLNVWQQFIDQPLNFSKQNIFTYRNLQSCNKDNQLTKEITKLIETSQSWMFTIEKSLINNSRCSIFLNRLSVYSKIIDSVIMDPTYGKANKDITTCIYFEDICSLESETVFNYRKKLVNNVLHNLIDYSKYIYKKDKDSCLILFDEDSTCAFPKHVKLICGIVKDSLNRKKLIHVSAAEYIKKRSIDMQLMAQHKYGLRVKNEKVFVELIHTLGLAAVAYDLLEVKYSSPVIVNFTGNSNGASKGATFILYNSARLETIFNTFYKKVESGYYPKLPPLIEVDLTLLKEEEEWILIFNYAVEFPNLISRTIGDLEHGHIAPHLICSFLNSIATTFSVYYRRVKILTENRPQLLPIMQARLYLLMCLKIIFNKSLALLNMKPVQQM